MIPTLEIIGFDLLLSNYNRHYSGSSDYDVSASSIKRNLRGPWVVDNDPFQVNQFVHPYQGSLYHGAARSAGLGYWEAQALTFAGSAWWEITGEKTPPSRNDQIASGIAGSFLGEPLFRIARLILDHSDLHHGWRNALATLVSPPVGLNRLLFGTRFDDAFADHNPAYYGRMHLGASRATQPDFNTAEHVERNTAELDLALDYGLPGQPDYTYKRPFDYFSVQAQLTSANAVETLSTRGLLFGTDYALGNDYRGIWGLYASYDYLAPQIFHVSTTSLSVGTTGQWWASKDLALQGTVLAGLGYAAANTARGVSDTSEYHYGTASRGALAMRVIDDDARRSRRHGHDRVGGPHHAPPGRPRRHQPRRHRIHLAAAGAARHRHQLRVVASQRQLSGQRRSPPIAGQGGSVLRVVGATDVRRCGLARPLGRVTGRLRCRNRAR